MTGLTASFSLEHRSEHCNRSAPSDGHGCRPASKMGPFSSSSLISASSACQQRGLAGDGAARDDQRRLEGASDIIMILGCRAGTARIASAPTGADLVSTGHPDVDRHAGATGADVDDTVTIGGKRSSALSAEISGQSLSRRAFRWCNACRWRTPRRCAVLGQPLDHHAALFDHIPTLHAAPQGVDERRRQGRRAAIPLHGRTLLDRLRPAPAVVA